MQASEWEGDLRVNMTLVITAARVLAKACAEAVIEIERLKEAVRVRGGCRMLSEGEQQ